jgi:integrase
MKDFFKDSDSNWWFKALGKGNKERDISVSDNMLDGLIRYRLSLGLSTLPNPSDNNPLLLRQKGLGAISSTRQIRAIVQYYFNQAIICLNNEHLNLEADELASATAHWLRHTGISDDIVHRPKEHVRDDAGHTSSAITDKYIDVERRERHASAKNKKIIPE